MDEKNVGKQKFKPTLMKLAIILAILLISIGAYLIMQDKIFGPTIKTTNTIQGTQELTLSGPDLQQLGMRNGGTDCQTEEYTTNEYSPLAQYSFCNYTTNDLDDTEIVIELKKFTNQEDLNGTYQYESLHLRSAEGLLSENEYGDQSRFYVNNENDYGGNVNTEPNVYYYHLWVCKDKYLIHITSKGSKEANKYIANMGQLILSKFS